MLYTCVVAVMGVGEWHVMYSYYLTDNKGPDERFGQVTLLTGLQAAVSVGTHNSVSVWVYTSTPLWHKYKFIYTFISVTKIVSLLTQLYLYHRNLQIFQNPQAIVQYKVPESSFTPRRSSSVAACETHCYLTLLRACKVLCWNVRETWHNCVVKMFGATAQTLVARGLGDQVAGICASLI